MSAALKAARFVAPGLADLVRRSARTMQALTVSDRYNLLGTHAFTASGLYLNLGYWRTARTIDEACEALAVLVAETASIGPDDEVVDVGFGFGDQDMLWMRRFSPRRIIGLNLTPSQVRIARHRVRRAGLADRIELREGSATAMPLENACCDVVTAVECAFHFNTRERFLAEAYRVLRPGGRLVLADVIRGEPASDPLSRRLQAFNWRQAARLLLIPEANADRQAGYREKIQTAGFEVSDLRSIQNDVFPGWHRALTEDPDLLQRIPLPGRLPYQVLRFFNAATIYGAFDYVLVTARKPGQVDQADMCHASPGEADVDL